MHKKLSSRKVGGKLSLPGLGLITSVEEKHIVKLRINDFYVAKKPDLGYNPYFGTAALKQHSRALDQSRRRPAGRLVGMDETS